MLRQIPPSPTSSLNPRLALRCRDFAPRASADLLNFRSMLRKPCESADDAVVSRVGSGDGSGADIGAVCGYGASRCDVPVDLPCSLAAASPTRTPRCDDAAVSNCRRESADPARGRPPTCVPSPPAPTSTFPAATPSMLCCCDTHVELLPSRVDDLRREMAEPHPLILDQPRFGDLVVVASGPRCRVIEPLRPVVGRSRDSWSLEVVRLGYWSRGSWSIRVSNRGMISEHAGLHA